MEEKNKTKVEMEGKDNEIQHPSLQQTDFINHLTNAKEVIMNLRSKNERLQNELNSKRKINERMMKSQVDMNQLNEQNLYRKKKKQELDTKKNMNLLNKVLKRIKDLLAIIVVRQVIHQTNVGAMVKKNSMESVTIAINMVIEQQNARRNLSLKVNVTNVRNMDKSHYNAKPRY